MELYIMQHGPYLPKDQDPDEGLSPEGKQVIQASGRALNKMGVTLDAILASPKKRSRETAAIIAEEVGFPHEGIIESEAVKAMTPAHETVTALSKLSDRRKLLIAGHLPSVAELASFLLTDGSTATIAFERGGCCRIDVETLPTHSGLLKWYLTPEQLQMIVS